MTMMAEDIARLMDVLEIENATLGGLSMGGYVVLAFYKQFFAPVFAGFVLADTRATGRHRRSENKAAPNKLSVKDFGGAARLLDAYHGS